MAIKLPKPTAHDLFDNSTMTFGEHLEALRIHLFKAIIGLVIATCFTLMIGDWLVRVINKPIIDALHAYGVESAAIEPLPAFDPVDWFLVKIGRREAEPLPPPPTEVNRDEVEVQVLPSQIASALHAADPKGYPALEPVHDEKPIAIRMRSPLFSEWREASERTLRPVTLNVQEGFMTYLKVSLAAGFVLASPWIFYQIWLFVAAGLYPHERKHVHFYLPVALTLFLGGATFCFFAVLPLVLRFLLGFNEQLGIVPQIRLNEWISFALMLPIMFGVSFQLPVVMLLVERLQIVTVETFREKRRLAILIIAILSMVLTPAEPTSMLAMMVPLIVLYELGIWMCQLRGEKPSPFGEPA